ncbi:MAG TPA: carboxypeptidase-like regulatory domain-containing protein [Candidatus Acidoferrales bacterium]|nr:carboxypeptidase-like regulatory domain-containing protein [Candidatus Acidoferrales bacterium]
MKSFIGILALAGMMALPALAVTGTSGVSGRIVDAGGHPVAHAIVGIFRMPLHRIDRAVAAVATDENGYFVKVPLQPGQYMIDVSAGANAEACAVHDLIEDSVEHVTMHVRTGSRCTPVRMHSATVNGNLTSDVYIVH